MAAKRNTTFFYVAAFFLIVGIGSFVLPLLGREMTLFKLFGDFAIVAKIACLALGAAALVIGFIRFAKSPVKKDETKPGQPTPPADKKDQ